MAEPEKKKLADTPEFKAAVAEAVGKLLPELAVQLAEARKAAGTSDAADVGGDMSWMRQLALTMAEISDQGTHRKRVAPELLAKRTAARERMGKLILAARAAGEMPEYRLIGEVYLNETRIAPFTNDPATKRPVPTDIGWTGAPNEVMRPLNEVAQGIFGAFMESIGGDTELTNWAKGGKSGNNGPAWVTANGLYVKGATSAQRRTIGNLADSNASVPALADTLVAKRSNDPTAQFVNVLGTVHPPARQNSEQPR